MAHKGGLGKGLDALIPSEPSRSAGSALYVPLDRIQPNPHQPRLSMAEDELQELADSIREHGILQPLLVAQNENGYTLIAGERRWRAAARAGLDTVPVIVRQATPQEMLELALIENVQRADLSPLETAEAYRQLSADFGLTHEEIGLKVGKHRTTVTNTLRLLELSDHARQALIDQRISEGHARALLALSSPQAQAAALESVLVHGLSVRQTEQLVARLQGEKPVPKAPPPVSPEVAAVEERLRSALGTRVVLQHGKKGGRVVIHYFSNEELESLISRLTKE